MGWPGRVPVHESLLQILTYTYIDLLTYATDINFNDYPFNPNAVASSPCPRLCHRHWGQVDPLGKIKSPLLLLYTSDQ